MSGSLCTHLPSWVGVRQFWAAGAGKEKVAGSVEVNYHYSQNKLPGFYHGTSYVQIIYG